MGEMKSRGMVRQRTVRPDVKGLPRWCIVAMMPGENRKVSDERHTGEYCGLTEKVQVRRDGKQIRDEDESGGDGPPDTEGRETNHGDDDAEHKAARQPLHVEQNHVVVRVLSGQGSAGTRKREEVRRSNLRG